MSIIPSRPMFTTPLRSREDAADRRECERSRVAEHRRDERRPDDDRVEMARCSSGWRGTPSTRPSTPIATAAQPSRCAADERPIAERRARSGRGRPERPADAICSGGSATQNAAIPTRIADATRVRGAPARDAAEQSLDRSCGLVAACRRPRLRRPSRHEDQHVGADEEHDEALDRCSGQVRRASSGRKIVGIEVARRRAGRCSAPKSSAASADADRCVASEQRDGDADEADRATTWIVARVDAGTASRGCRSRPRGRRTRPRSPSRGSSSARR